MYTLHLTNLITMKSELEKIRTQQKKTWNKFPTDCDKWEGFIMDWPTCLEDEVIWALHSKPTNTVLVAAGSTTWLKMRY